MADNALEKIPRDCKDCSLLSRLSVIDTFENWYPKPITGDSEFLENYERVYNAFCTGGPVPKGTKPLKLEIQLGEMCNFRCIMCPQNHSDRNKIDSKIIQEIKAVIPVCQSFLFTGGEPLVYKEIWPILDEIQHRANTNANVCILTNLSLLTRDKVEQYFSNIQNLVLGVNIDAANQETYEKIRVGGKWSTLMENIKFIREYSKKHNKNWKINMGFVIMKSNIEEMKDAIKLCGEFRIGFGCGSITGDYFPIQNCRTYLKENIFRFKHLCTEDYILTHLNKAMEATQYLDDASRIGAVANIQGVINSVGKTPRIGIPRIILLNILKLNDQSLSRIIKLWVVGSIKSNAVKGLLKKRENNNSPSVS
jgi:molybdenum cofactor biosynthesis enzyme MoaA